MRELILPEIKGVTKVAQSQFFCIESVDLLFSNGVRTTYERLRGGIGAVMVIPFDGKNFIFSREYCVGTENYELGFVRGKREVGELAEESALRELGEEIGLGAKKISLLRVVNFAPGFMTLKMHVFLVEDLFQRKLESGDEPEEITTTKVSLNEAESWVYDINSPLSEARSIMGLMYAIRLIRSKSEKVNNFHS